MNLVYDFRVAPNSFDFATFLANGFLYSRLKGEKIRKVVIVQVAFRPEPSWGNRSIPRAYESQKVDTVAYPLARMLVDEPSVVVHSNFESLQSDRDSVGFPPGFDPRALGLATFSASSLLPCNEIHTNQLFGAAGVLPHPFAVNERFADRATYLWGGRYATVTIRNSGLNQGRNDIANLVERFRVPLRASLNQLGIKLVLVPDRENLKSDHPSNQFDGENVDFEAAMSLPTRYALYSRSLINISPATGPNILLVFSPFPYFIYGSLDESIPVMTSSFFARKGPQVGSQRPWASRVQWTDWVDRRMFEPERAIRKIEELVGKK